VALASLVMSETFGVEVPRVFAEQTVDLLAPEVRLWVDRYRRDLVVMDHPGSKLYLLLHDVLEGDVPQWQQTRRSRLLPLHLPPRVMPKSGDSLGMRWRDAISQTRFAGKRLRFHLAQGVRYKLEAARWRRFVAGAGL
jgi:hypothetical protein